MGLEGMGYVGTLLAIGVFGFVAYRMINPDERERARGLLRRGAQVNSVNKDGRTALHDAISSGSQPIVRQLLDHGANIHLRSNAGKDAPAYAAERKQVAIVEMLRQYERVSPAQ